MDSFPDTVGARLRAHANVSPTDGANRPANNLGYTAMEWKSTWPAELIEVLVPAMPLVKAVFWSLTGLLILMVMRRSITGVHHKTISRAYRVFFFVVALLFTAILAYQATWQLAGFARPDFVEFMQRYNRRADNPAARIVRGSILDAQKTRLAVTEPATPAKRWYPGGAAFCHIVGYDHPLYGMAGIEAAEQAALSGILHVTAPEWERFRRNLVKRDDLRGSDIAVTLHAGLQQAAHELMKGTKGAVVILNPTDGAILVLYSSPGYDPNNLNPTLFARKDSQARLLNRALQGLYPAGSAFKVLVAAAALEKGLDPRFDCPAEGYRAGVASQPIRDHEYYEYRRKGKTWPGHGTLGMREALAKSSNVYFARLGVQVGGPALRAAAVRCGITRSWTLLEGSSGKLACMAGNIPPLSDRDLAKTAQIAIGQGDLLVTPLHMAVLAGAIGQGGALCPPRLSATAPVKPADRVFPPQVARTLTAMMRQVVTHGTGRGADIAGLDVAGKTGTAQNPHGADHGWFIGFAPADNPVLAFAVIVEAGGFGSQSALPVAAGLLRKAQALGLFDPPSRQEVPR